MSDRSNNVVYIGMTSNLKNRVWQHKLRKVDGFTKKYHCTKLVYYEYHDDVWTSIERERTIKKWRRNKKDALVSRMNPEWNDLFEELSGDG